MSPKGALDMALAVSALVGGGTTLYDTVCSLYVPIEDAYDGAPKIEVDITGTGSWRAVVGKDMDLPVWQALLARDWSRLFVELRPLWAQSTLLLFGHALTEKLVAPYKSITAHVLRLPVPADLPADAAAARVHPWDDWLAGQLTPEWLATKPYTPLPVLGRPGWWPANEDPDFYADAQVFRPARTLSACTPFTCAC